MERKTGFEPAAFSLARRCSTAELLPHRNQARTRYYATRNRHASNAFSEKPNIRAAHDAEDNRAKVPLAPRLTPQTLLATSPNLMTVSTNQGWQQSDDLLRSRRHSVRKRNGQQHALTRLDNRNSERGM